MAKPYPLPRGLTFAWPAPRWQRAGDPHTNKGCRPVPRPGGRGILSLPDPGAVGSSARVMQAWTLWWNGRQIANVQPSANGVSVTLACRKLWQDKQVRAASIAQGKRYAERWCAARVLPHLSLRQAVERITTTEEPARPARTATVRQQERRLREALRPPIVR